MTQPIHGILEYCEDWETPTLLDNTLYSDPKDRDDRVQQWYSTECGKLLSLIKDYKQQGLICSISPEVKGVEIIWHSTDYKIRRSSSTTSASYAMKFKTWYDQTLNAETSCELKFLEEMRREIYWGQNNYLATQIYTLRGSTSKSVADVITK